MFASRGTAQIVYTDVNPDATCTGTASCLYDLDLNNDGVIDFTFKYLVSTGPCLCGPPLVEHYYVRLLPTSGNGVMNNTNGPLALISGSLIDATMSFSTVATQSLAWSGMSCIGGCHGTAQGNWSGANDRYLGLHIQVGITNYYGWARLNVGPRGNAFTIKDYAYNSMPGGLILAGDLGGPLPVQFLNLAAQKKGAGVSISWSTQSEYNNDYFVVEKSTNGNDWYSLLTVKGNGNSSTTKNYLAYDAKPSLGINYYRIKQVDKDRHFKYSDIVLYKLTIESIEISVLTNPVENNIGIDILNPIGQMISFQLFNYEGSQVLSQNIYVKKGVSRQDVQVDKLNRGIYILKITDRQGQTWSTKLLKE